MDLTTTIEGVDFIAGHVLEFECDADHAAKGCNYAVCLANGTWDVTDNAGCLPGMYEKKPNQVMMKDRYREYRCSCYVIDNA